ncbi:MAG: sel1 repeat family protein [Trueperaceae bacterium]|nr:MAG: sel1 repeat family protein [Trueperaceae bacterium]
MKRSLWVTVTIAVTLGAAFANRRDGIIAFETGNYQAAWHELLPFAEAGDGQAQYLLGLMLERGLYVEQSYLDAARWYEKAVLGGNGHAMGSLGMLYSQGLGVEHDLVEAAALFVLAAGAARLARDESLLGFALHQFQRITLALSSHEQHAAEVRSLELLRAIQAHLEADPPAQQDVRSKISSLPKDDRLGTFTDGRLFVTIDGGKGRYQGTIEFEGRSFPFTARTSGNGLTGTFESDGSTFGFTAELTGESLTFTTGGAAFILQKQTEAVDTPPT